MESAAFYRKNESDNKLLPSLKHTSDKFPRPFSPNQLKQAFSLITAKEDAI